WNSGIAIGDNKPCYALGNLELSVLYYPVHHCDTIGVLLDELARAPKRDRWDNNA
ncbi:unnamed protein product, partial [marine sediment metagenome]